MFFGYPIAATAGNWLHDCLCEMITALHTSIAAGQQPATWPTIIPAAHRPRLRLRTGLRDRLAVYAVALQALTPAQRMQVFTCLAQQNAIADLVSGASDCDDLNDLPSAIREPAKALFVFAFELLTDLEIRDAHYAIIYDTIGSKVCPFCALE